MDLEAQSLLLDGEDSVDVRPQRRTLPRAAFFVVAVLFVTCLLFGYSGSTAGHERAATTSLRGFMQKARRHTETIQLLFPSHAVTKVVKAANAATEAMKTARAAELAAGQARRYKYFAKSARDAAQNALKEMEGHLAKDRADPKKMHIYSAETPVWMLALSSGCCEVRRTDSKPSQTFAISPEMSLTRQDDEEGEGLAASYILKGPSMSAAHSLCFEDGSIAGNFVRDFRVRSRLMDMSLKTVRGRAAAQDLRKDLESLKQRSLAAQAWTVIRLLLVVAILLVAARTAHLVSQDSGRPPLQYLVTIGQDIGSALHLSASATSAAGAKVCEVAFGTVDAGGLRQCSKEVSAQDMRQCIDSLVGYAPAMGW